MNCAIEVQWILKEVNYCTTPTTSDSTAVPLKIFISYYQPNPMCGHSYL